MKCAIWQAGSSAMNQTRRTARFGRLGKIRTLCGDDPAYTYFRAEKVMKNRPHIEVSVCLSTFYYGAEETPY